jgi:hypothetical protein
MPFEQVGARAGLQGAKDVFVAVVGGEHNEARVPGVSMRMRWMTSTPLMRGSAGRSE